MFDWFKKTAVAVNQDVDTITPLAMSESEVLKNHGNVYLNDGKLKDAAECFRQAIALNPRYAEAYTNLGLIFQMQGNLDEAIAHYRKAVEFKPSLLTAHMNLGIVLKEVGRLPEAEASYHSALELQPNYAGAHNNLGILLEEARRLPEAEASYRSALELQPDYAEAHCNLGMLLVQTRHLSEAEASYRRALELKPDYADAHHNLGLLLLSLGRYTEAWPHHEYRYNPNTNPPACKIPDLPYPQWRGEPLIGKSLVIWPEQGFGDYIQFVRYVPLLKERGVMHLTLVCVQPLKALLETVSGVDAVITELESTAHHDYWTFPLSLPLYFGTTVDNIPSTQPYLYALPARVDKWRHRLPKGKFRVGLVWKGNADQPNDVNRSLPGLSTLAPLWSVPGVTFISLQKGQGEDEAKHPSADQPVLHLGVDIGDFADTAAIIDQLDLVICVCTSVAHLAGAMGKPCWVLITTVNPCWRWLQEREDSPWYPSLRLFRQVAPNDWSQPVERIRQKLLAITQAGS